MHKQLLPLLLASLLALSSTAKAQQLTDVLPVDDSYAYEIKDEFRIGVCKAQVVRLTSQTWQGKPWQHWLTILKPDNTSLEDAAILFISGGSSQSGQPDASNGEVKQFALIAAICQVPVAILNQVPNQPLQGKKYEDDLIAYTFDKYMNGLGEDWPLLLPMVESAVRAMDTTAAILKEQSGTNITRFSVAGASKRGWTTWLTSAVDPRVVSIAPMVIDVLNMPVQMRQQFQSYGRYSHMITPYLKYNFPERMLKGEGKKLTELVDPFSYREKIQIPKLIVLGTNDPYWTVDASSIYFPDLVGPKNLYYLPNGGHGLGIQVLPTMATFFKKTLNNHTLEKMKWELDSKNYFHVKWTGKPRNVHLWKAHSATRDFREAKWESTRLEDITNSTKNLLEVPSSGYNAFFIDLEFPGAGTFFYNIATEIQVLPKGFEYDPPEPQGSDN
ncbi:MAG: PhoPQ-activated pathogenicity-related family protein [Pirellulales bacterium]|nr:PhoPQ-activated pathogenicity-related family protein [Pirellulales bacterium]